jgi:RHS repeat-associated protein
MDDQTKRKMLFTWDEENQLLQTEEQGKLTIYRYDDSGTRVIKRGKYGEVLYVNENYSLRNGEVGTKHVFAGNTRIATKITMKEQKLNASKATYDKSEGGHNGRVPEKSNGNRLGWGKKVDTGAPVHESKGNAYGQVKQAERGHEIPGQLKQLDKATGSAENAKGKGKSKTNENANAKSQEKAHPHDHKYDTELPGNSEKGLENALAHGKGHKYGIYKRLARRGLIVNSSGDIVPVGSDGDDVSEDDGSGDGDSSISTVGNATGAVPDEFGIYYYHGDHLGSSNQITDRKGRNYEHVEYFPYGETWVQEQRNTTHLPYRFTGKELDPETGMYYYGARYYDPRTSVWVSADPILDEYLPFKGQKNNEIPAFGGVYNPINLSIYAYAYYNPVGFVDPDGNNSGPIDPGPGLFGRVNIESGNWLLDNTVLGMFNTAANTANYLTNSLFNALGFTLDNPVTNFLGSDEMTGFSASTSYPHDDVLPMAGKAMVFLGSKFKGVTNALKVISQNRKWGRADTLLDHFKRHGPDFKATSADDYAKKAMDFFQQAKKQNLPTKIDKHGVTRIYDPKTNTFGSYNPNGTTRTFYKPTDGAKYFNGQPGVLQ